MSVLYTAQTAKIHFIGCYSNILKIRRVIHQGCPLSPILFNLVFETLVLTVKKNSAIHGIIIIVMQEEHKTVLYADDVAFFFFTAPYG